MSPSIWQILIVLLIVLVLFGPSRIGGLGKSMGQAIRGFKKGLSEDPEIDVTSSTHNEQLRDGDRDPDSSSTKKEKDKV